MYNLCQEISRYLLDTGDQGAPARVDGCDSLALFRKARASAYGVSARQRGQRGVRRGWVFRPMERSRRPGAEPLQAAPHRA